MTTYHDILKLNREISRLQRSVYKAVLKQDSNLSSLITELKQKIDEFAALQITE